MRTVPLDRLRATWRVLLKEITAFGVVGAVNFVVDLGIFNLLYRHLGMGPMFANGISTTVATLLAYFANRHWSFSHRARSGLGRETAFFFAINLIAFGFSSVVFAIVAYPLHYKYNGVVMNIVKVGTIGLGTIFRFWAYKRFVFLAHDHVKARPASSPVISP